MEPAVFRPPLRRLGAHLLAGAAAGAAVGLLAQIPPMVAALFGAVAAAIAVTARHAGALRAVADARGLRVLGAASPVDGAWGELRLGFGLAQRADGQVQRYAVVADARGRSFAFAEPAAGPAAPSAEVRGADGRPVPVVELRDAPLLLGLLVQRVPAWQVLPEALQQAAAAPAAAPAPAAPAAPAAPPPGAAAAGSGANARRGRVGALGLVAKLGSKLAASFGKLAAGGLKVVKTANVGWAAASLATWSLLFSWKFALAILVQLFIHEYGHVHAMRRTGMRVRGLYFVPLVGAMAVTDDAFTSRRQQVYVALNGPLWGSLAALAPAGLWLWTHDPTWAAVAAFWALLNLFNLLPIAPLDGGRALQAFAYSYSSGLGVALSALGLAGAVALATAAGFSLVWLVVLLGGMELAGEVQSRGGARALRLLPEPARFGPAHWLYLRAVLGGRPGTPGDALFLHGLARQEKAARAAPLTAGQLLRWGLAYAALAAALVLLVWLLRAVPGAEAASRILE